MARRKMTAQQQIEKGLSELAFGSCSDAIKLLFMSDEEIMQRLPKLKLINISEIKRPKGGGMEIKFFDRILNPFFFHKDFYLLRNILVLDQQ